MEKEVVTPPLKRHPLFKCRTHLSVPFATLNVVLKFQQRYGMSKNDVLRSAGWQDEGYERVRNYEGLRE